VRKGLIGDRPRGIDFELAQRAGTSVSARATAAQFQVTADSDPLEGEPAATPSVEVTPVANALPAAVRLYLQNSVAVQPNADPMAQFGQPPTRLPLAWTKTAADTKEVPERSALIITAVAATCLIAGGALALWLGSGSKPQWEIPVVTVSVTSKSGASQLVAGRADGKPSVGGAASETASANGVTTAQILAVAERFVATGDILAARAILSDRVAVGEARAMFALAETYDPNMLRFWIAQDIEANTSYARLLYDGARRGGMSEAQARLDALP
jgi:hypothetical protein